MKGVWGVCEDMEVGWGRVGEDNESKTCEVNDCETIMSVSLPVCWNSRQLDVGSNFPVSTRKGGWEGRGRDCYASV
jgi:hypothetical protein